MCRMSRKPRRSPMIGMQETMAPRPPKTRRGTKASEMRGRQPARIRHGRGNRLARQLAGRGFADPRASRPGLRACRGRDHRHGRYSPAVRSLGTRGRGPPSQDAAQAPQPDGRRRRGRRARRRRRRLCCLERISARAGCRCRRQCPHDDVGADWRACRRASTAQLVPRFPCR